MVMSDYLGYDHWRNPRQFSSCERFGGATVNEGTLLSSALWGGTTEGDTEPNQVPKVRLRAAYLDGHVSSYGPEALTGVKVIWKVDTGEPYPSGIGPGEFFIREKRYGNHHFRFSIFNFQFSICHRMGRQVGCREGVNPLQFPFQHSNRILWKGQFVKRWITVGILAWATVSVQSSPIAEPGSRGVDWAKVKIRIETQDWARAIVSRMRTDVATTQKRYAEPPLGESGWFHDYYCPKTRGGWCLTGKSQRSIDARDAGRCITAARMTMCGGGGS